MVTYIKTEAYPESYSTELLPQIRNVVRNLNHAQEYLRLSGYKDTYSQRQIVDLLDWCEKHGVKIEYNWPVARGKFAAVTRDDAYDAIADMMFDVDG